MEKDKPEYYSEVMHGYIVHERSRKGYSDLLRGGKVLMLLTALSGLGILAFASPAGPSSTYGVIIMAVALFILLGLGWVEKRYGKPVLRLRRKPDSGSWEWEFEEPKPTKEK